MIRALEKILAPLKRRVRLMVSRAILTAIDDSKGLQQVQLTALSDEVLDRVERLQEYGFTSVPLKGGSALIVCVGGSRSHPVVIATDDPRHRPTGLQPGEVAIYTQSGSRINLKNGGIIELIAATKIVLQSTLVEISGNLSVAGNVTVPSGTVTAGVTSLTTHVHGGVTSGGATTGTPI